MSSGGPLNYITKYHGNVMYYCDTPSQVESENNLFQQSHGTFCLFHNFALISISKYPGICHFHFLKSFYILIKKGKMMCYHNFSYFLIVTEKILSLKRHVISWNCLLSPEANGWPLIFSSPVNRSENSNWHAHLLDYSYYINQHSFLGSIIIYLDN